MSKKPYDDAFKDLAEQDAISLLRLLDALPPNATVTPLPREISVQALLPDQPYEVNVAGQRQITHIEAQTRYPEDMPQREADYSIRMWLKYRLPIYTYVLVFLPAGMPQEVPTSITIEAGDVSLTVRFKVIGLWEIPTAKALALKSESLLPFIPLMKGGAEELGQGLQALGQVEDEVRRRELALHFVMLGGLRYKRIDLLEMLGRMNMVLPMEVLKESEMYKLIIEEGLEQGLEQGREEGRRASLIDLLQRMAGRKFPGLALDAEIESLRDLGALEQLCLDFEQFADAAALRQQIAAIASK